MLLQGATPDEVMALRKTAYDRAKATFRCRKAFFARSAFFLTRSLWTLGSFRYSVGATILSY